MPQCRTCGRPIEANATHCSFCLDDIRSAQRRRTIRRLWIGFASLLTLGGMWMVWSYWHSYDDPALSLFGGLAGRVFERMGDIGKDPASIHHRLPPNFVYINNWTLSFAWALIAYVWYSIFRKDKDPALGDL